MTPSRRSNARVGAETRDVLLKNLALGDPVQVRSSWPDVFADVTELRPIGEMAIIVKLANGDTISGRPSDYVRVLRDA